MKVKRMTVEQYIQINDWLKLNKDRIEKTEYSQLEAAAIAGKELGFDVPLSSIQRCAKMANIVWANSPPKLPPVPIDREAIIILIGALSGLYIEEGKTVPDNLANLQSRYVKENIVEPPTPPNV